MKKVLFLLMVSMVIASCRNQSEWKLAWEENFDGMELDTAVWSLIPRGELDWQNTMSSDERCYELRDGALILRGVINEDLQKDSSPYPFCLPSAETTAHSPENQCINSNSPCEGQR